ASSMITTARAPATMRSIDARANGVPVGLLGEQRYTIAARAAITASASTSYSRVNGTSTGSSAFMRANAGIIANDGSGITMRSPGSPNARMAESSTSSEPQPVTTDDGSTPAYRAS